MSKKSSSKKSSQNTKQGKRDDPLKQYIVLDPATMKMPSGRFVVIPVDTEDITNRMCWAIGLSAYADALEVFGRKKQACLVVELAADMATNAKSQHPELFRKERQDVKGSGGAPAGTVKSSS
jgi:hypothetical protein